MQDVVLKSVVVDIPPAFLAPNFFGKVFVFRMMY